MSTQAWKCLAVGCATFSLLILMILVWVRIHSRRMHRHMLGVVSTISSQATAVVTTTELAAAQAQRPPLGPQEISVPARVVVETLRTYAARGTARGAATPSAPRADGDGPPDDAVCGICFESADSDVLWLRCGHPFHCWCVVGWLEKGTCPTCRGPMWPRGEAADAPP